MFHNKKRYVEKQKKILIFLFHCSSSRSRSGNATVAERRAVNFIFFRVSIFLKIMFACVSVPSQSKPMQFLYPLARRLYTDATNRYANKTTVTTATTTTTTFLLEGPHLPVLTLLAPAISRAGDEGANVNERPDEITKRRTASRGTIAWIIGVV